MALTVFANSTAAELRSLSIGGTHLRQALKWGSTRRGCHAQHTACWAPSRIRRVTKDAK